MSNKSWLDELDKDFAPSVVWDKPGEKIVGKFLRVDIADNGAGYGPSPVVNFQAMEGSTAKDAKGKILVAGQEYGLWLFHDVLLNQFKEKKPSEGEEFGVVYKGKKESSVKGREPYANYRLMVNRPASASTWESIAVKPREAASDVEPS